MPTLDPKAMMQSVQSLRVLLVALLGIALLAPVGCSGRPDWRKVDLTDPAVGGPLIGTPSIDVENVRGIVTIIVDPKTKTPYVGGRVYPDPDLTKPIREQAADESTFTAEVVAGDAGPVVRVRATPPAEALDTANVEITIHLASCYGVTVRNAGGAVRMEGVAGPITVENGWGGVPGGMVIVRTGQTMTEAVTLTTTDGDIYYQIPPTSTGTLDLLSLEGPADLRAEGGRLTQVRPEYSWYRGILNAGNNPIVLRSGKGMVRVTVLDNAATHVPAE
jgi:hypothetical protein